MRDVGRRWQASRLLSTRRGARWAVLLLALGGPIALWWWIRKPPELLRRLPASTGRLSTVVFSPGGQRLAAGAAGGQVLAWDTATWQPVPLTHLSQQPITALTWSPDEYLIAATLSKRLLAYQWSTRQARILPPMPADITALAYHPREPVLLIGLNDGRLVLLNTRTARQSEMATGHRGSVKSIAIGASGQRFVTAGADGHLIWREWRTRQVLRDVAAHGAEISTVAMSADEMAVASADWDGMVRLWSRQGDELDHWQHPDGIGGLAWCGATSEDWLASGTWNGQLSFLSRDQTSRVIETRSPIHGLSTSVELGLVATVGPAAEVRLWRIPAR